MNTATSAVAAPRPYNPTEQNLKTAAASALSAISRSKAGLRDQLDIDRLGVVLDEYLAPTVDFLLHNYLAEGKGPASESNIKLIFGQYQKQLENITVVMAYSQKFFGQEPYEYLEKLGDMLTHMRRRGLVWRPRSKHYLRFEQWLKFICDSYVDI